MNPYRKAKDYQFWRREVAGKDVHAFDPVVQPKFLIGRDMTVATAGSCFAQHISARLSDIGFNYYVAEAGLELSSEERKRRGFGVFSARYGNIYTTRQLIQLFDQCFGRRAPSELVWRRKDGRLVDPFRPTIEPDGFGEPMEVAEARRAHLAFVRDIFTRSDVFIFTLGLTESWRSKRDRSVFPLAPGVAGGSYSDEEYEFYNMKTVDVIEDLQYFIAGLRGVNPSVRILLTVSPVPLNATYENQNVMVATTYSKSVLRAAAGEVSSEFDFVDYFPSYEIITGNYAGGLYYSDDLRTVNSAGVSHAMRCFLNNYVDESNQQIALRGDGPNLDYNLVCDEELLDRLKSY